MATRALAALLCGLSMAASGAQAADVGELALDRCSISVPRVSDQLAWRAPGSGSSGCNVQSGSEPERALPLILLGAAALMLALLRVRKRRR